jgi:hypothetical protein
MAFKKYSALLLLAAQTLFVSPGLAAADLTEVSELVLGEELEKQRGIYGTKGTAVPSGYVIDRSLLSYTYALSEPFNRALAGLGPNDRWLDIGAGEGHAILDYCTAKYDALHDRYGEAPEKKARAVAISIEDRRTERWHTTAASVDPGQIQYLFGKTLREYAPQELGRFQVITDVMGGFSYSNQLSVFMERALSLLEVNGSFHTVLADVHSESGRNKPHYEGSPYLTEISTRDGAEVKVCSWLKRIACVEVTCEFKPNWTPPIEVYHIRKTCEDVKVPALLPVHYTAGTPPERGYRLYSPTPPAPVGRVAEPSEPVRPAR